ncbi:MAG TPA: ABC transporter ATP-binding protein [Patescibacteria group bacterium]|nr:ABC transporter ATP-binding protein [Patescibacteria group bacterium]
MPAITFQDFSYQYPSGQAALENIELQIPEGSFTVVAGPSGAGKTTLCLAIAGVVPHYHGGRVAGRVTVAGLDTRIAGLAQMAERVGTVMEDYESQLVCLTVEEDVAFGLENRGMASKDIMIRVKEVLQLTGLEGRGKLEVSALSGGQKQRLAIAGVLAVQPAVLVLDEATSALDPEGAADIYRLLYQLNRQQGMTVVVVEHDLAKVLPYADQFLLLQDGKLAEAGKPAMVLTQMRQHRVFTEALPPLWRLKLGLEESGCGPLGDWRDESDAVAELTGRITGREMGVKESA